MTVYCPGCGTKIDARPDADSPEVQCPRCHSWFSTAGVKPPPPAPPQPRFRKKKPGGGKFVGALIFGLVLLLLGGGTVGALYLTGVIGPRSPGGSGGAGGPGAASAAWQEYVSTEGKFHVLFPGTPTREVFPQPGRSKGTRPQAVSFTVETPDVAYSVAYQDFDPSGPRADSPEQFLQRQHDDLAGGRGGKLLSEKDVASGSHKGKEFAVEVANRGPAHMRFFPAGRRLYKVMAVGVRRPPEPGEVAKLFDSFQITD